MFSFLVGTLVPRDLSNGVTDVTLRGNACVEREATGRQLLGSSRRAKFPRCRHFELRFARQGARHFGRRYAFRLVSRLQCQMQLLLEETDDLKTDSQRFYKSVKK
jgi:hypothetical protein